MLWLKKNRSTFLFCSLLIVVGAFHALLIPYVPEAWQDEMQILELGRPLFYPTDWSAYWVSVPGSTGCYFQLWGFGSLIQSVAYECIGGWSHRYVGLAFFLGAAAMSFLYFRKKSGNAAVGFVCGLIMLLAPYAAHSAIGGRCDCHCFFFLFLSLFLFESLRACSRVRGAMYCLVGLISALAVFSWNTAPVLAPILLWAYAEAVFGRTRADILKSLACMLGGGGLVFVLGALPALPNLSVFWAIVNDNAGVKGFHLPKLLYQLIRSDGFYVVGFLGLCLRWQKNWMLILGGSAFLALCSVNKTYGFRLLYFLPYAMIGVYSVLATLKTAKARMMFVAFYALVFAEQLTTPVSWFWRPYFRNYVMTQQEFERAIGQNEKVYIGPWNMYFIGRNLNWKLFKPYFETEEEMRSCILQADWCIVTNSKSGDRLRRLAEENGYSLKQTIQAPMDEPGGVVERLLVHMGQVRKLEELCVYHRGADESK